MRMPHLRHPVSPSARKAAAIGLAAWTVLALLFAPQTYFLSAGSPNPRTWGESLAAMLLLFYAWAALTPLVLWLGRRFPVERERAARNAALLALCSVPCCALPACLRSIVSSGFGSGGSMPMPVSA